MLVLSRKRGERIVARLPDDREIVVTLVEIRGSDKVRLGFDAPEDVRIWREELLKREAA